MTHYETLSDTRVFEGRQRRIRHESTACAAPMTLSIFEPPGPASTSTRPGHRFRVTTRCLIT